MGQERQDLRSPSGYLQGGLGRLGVGSKLGVELEVGAEALQPPPPVPSFQVGKQLSARVKTIHELPKNCSSTFHSFSPDPWVALSPRFTDGDLGPWAKATGEVTHWQTRNRNPGLPEQRQKPRLARSLAPSLLPLPAPLPLTGWRRK